LDKKQSTFAKGKPKQNKHIWLLKMI